jgi:hypothetical protein
MPGLPAGQTTAPLRRFGLPAFAAVRPKVPAHCCCRPDGKGCCVWPAGPIRVAAVVHPRCGRLGRPGRKAPTRDATSVGCRPGAPTAPSMPTAEEFSIWYHHGKGVRAC